MTAGAAPAPSSRYFGPAFAFMAPFLVYVGLMLLPLSPAVLFPVRCVVVLGVLVFSSRPFISLKPSRPLASAAVGVFVFVLWVAPNLLFDYRHHWLFENGVTGHAASSLTPALRANVLFLAIRVLSSVALVPVLEELFWRGWLMRWWIDRNFLEVRLGTYQAAAFWVVALLFASEHGPYWEVGLIAGIAYNLWLIHTGNLADCMLAHAVTNGTLAAYVLTAGQWQYWL
jgi:CAAX prenyl protease-like protein